MPGESYHRWLRSLLLYLRHVFRVLMNSVVYWFCMSTLGLILFQICSMQMVQHKKKISDQASVCTQREDKNTKIYIYLLFIIKALGSIPLQLFFLFEKVEVCGHCLVALSITSYWNIILALIASHLNVGIILVVTVKLSPPPHPPSPHL